MIDAQKTRCEGQAGGTFVFRSAPRMLDCYERHCREDVVEADPVRRRQGAGAFIRAIDRGNLRDGGEGCFLALCGKMDERASAESQGS